MEQPDLGWTTNVEVSKVTDGDTVKVKFSREIDVRLSNYNAPEIRRPASDYERKQGRIHKSYLQELVDGGQCVLFIETSGKDRVKDIFCIGSRAVGNIFVDGKDVGDLMKEKFFEDCSICKLSIRKDLMNEHLCQ